jgi:hypothetical protein
VAKWLLKLYTDPGKNVELVMDIRTKQIIHKASDHYPYDYRVEVDVPFHDKVLDWLKENSIPHTTTGLWGVFYMKEEHVGILLLRWS